MCQNHFHTQYILDKCADKTLMLLRLACKEFRFQTNPSFYVCAQLQLKDPEIHRGMVECTDYGRPMKPFFIEIQNFWAWANKLGR